MPGDRRRTGAGRKFSRMPSTTSKAVVKGLTAPDPARIMAARVLIGYQKAKARVPVASPSRQKLHEKAAKDVDRSRVADFEAKAAQVRERFKAKQECGK